MMSIRDEMTRSQDDSTPGHTPNHTPPFPARYLSSQYLMGSSLTADVAQYDFSLTSKLATPPTTPTTSDVTAPEVLDYVNTYIYSNNGIITVLCT